MASLNKVLLIGNLGQDPDVRYTADGAAIVNVSIATADRYKDKETNEQKENVEWHRVVFFGRVAEIAAEYLKKGSSVYIEGKLRTRKWQNKEGQDQYTTEIVAETLKMLGGRRDDDVEHDKADSPAAKAKAIKDKPKKSKTVSVDDDGIDDADIPEFAMSN